MSNKDCKRCYTINKLIKNNNNRAMINLFCAFCKNCNQYAFTENETQYIALQKELNVNGDRNE